MRWETVLASSFLRIFLWCFDVQVLCAKDINQTTNSKNSDFSAFISVPTTSLWWVLYRRMENYSPENSRRGKERRQLKQSESPLCDRSCWLVSIYLIFLYEKMISINMAYSHIRCIQRSIKLSSYITKCQMSNIFFQFFQNKIFSFPYP